MKTFTKILAGGAGLAALATAAPATAQYYPYGYNNYSYANPYAYNANAVAMAQQQCTAAVQNRLYNRAGLAGIVGSLFGLSGTSARVLNVTRVTPNRTFVRVRGLATSGRYAATPYGYGYYGALGAGYTADLSFKCDVDYRGYVRDIDIERRY
jgi:hypothetical protein